MTKITLPGSPLSINRLYRRNSRSLYMTAEGKAKKREYQIEIKNQWKKKMMTDKVSLEIEYYFKDERKRDIDNPLKLILDSMEKIVYENDSQVRYLSLLSQVDRENPRVEIRINKFKIG